MADKPDTPKSLLEQAAELPGYDLRDGVLYYQGGACNMSETALRQILDNAGMPYDAMGPDGRDDPA